MNTLHFYWDYGTFVEEITDPMVCLDIFDLYLSGKVGNLTRIWLSPASNNFFVTP